MNIKKRLLSVLMAVSILCSIFPPVVLAGNALTYVTKFDELTSAISAASDGDTIIINDNITAESTTTMNLKCANGTITIECAEGKTLTVNGKLNLQSNFILKNMNVEFGQNGYINFGSGLTINIYDSTMKGQGSYVLNTGSGKKTILNIYSGTFSGGTTATIYDNYGAVNFYPQGDITVDSIYRGKNTSTYNAGITITQQAGYTISSATWNNENITFGENGSISYSGSTAETYRNANANDPVLSIKASKSTAGSYSITKNSNIAGGTVSTTVDGKAVSEAAPNTTVTVTATPDTGYKLSSISVTDSGGQTVEVTNNSTFTMPASNVTVNATFVAESYTLQIQQESIGTLCGKVTLSWGTDGETLSSDSNDDKDVRAEIPYGTTVMVTAIPKNDCQLTRLAYSYSYPSSTNDALSPTDLKESSSVVSDNSLGLDYGKAITTTFKMPAANVYVAAAFDKVGSVTGATGTTDGGNTYAVYGTGSDENTRYGTYIISSEYCTTQDTSVPDAFDKSDGVVTGTNEAVLTANVQVAPEPGVLCKSLTVSPKDDNQGTISTTYNENTSTYSFPMPAEDVTVNVEFVVKTYILQVQKSSIEQLGGEVTLSWGTGDDRKTLSSNSSQTDGLRAQIPAGTTVTVTATPDTGTGYQLTRLAYSYSYPTTPTSGNAGGVSPSLDQDGNLDSTKAITTTFEMPEANVYVTAAFDRASTVQTTGTLNTDTKKYETTGGQYAISRVSAYDVDSSADFEFPTDSDYAENKKPWESESKGINAVKLGTETVKVTVSPDTSSPGTSFFVRA